MDTKLRWQSVSLSASSIRDIRQEWEGLILHATEKNIYLFPWFIEASLSLLEEKKSQIISIYYDNLLIGLLIVNQDIGYAKFPFIFYRNSLHADQFLATPLVHRDFTDQFAQGLCHWLDNCPAFIALKIFTLMPTDNAIFRSLQTICTSQKRPLIAIESKTRAVIKPHNHSIESAWNQLSKQRQKSLNRAQKKLSQAGNVKVEKLEDTGDIEEWLEGFLQMEHSGWKGANKSSTLSIAEDAVYFRAMVRSAHAHRAMNFFRLTLDGNPISYTFDLIAKPYGYCHKSAYDEVYRSYSPGVILEYETMQYYLSNEGLDLIDSCTSPDNDMLNSLWPDRRELIDLAVLRSGKFYQWPFLFTYGLKSKFLKLMYRFKSD